MIYDCYGEDGDFAYINGFVGSGVLIQTSGNYFRSGYARCGVSFSGTSANCYGQRLWLSGPQTTAWCSFRVWNSNATSSNPYIFLDLVDTSGLPRIRILNTSGNGVNGPYTVYTVNSSGTINELGTTSGGFTPSPTVPDKLDINFNYSMSGSLTIYINSSQVFSYTGNITTNSISELAGVNHGVLAGNSSSQTAWSECIVSSTDTRNLSVITCAARSAGTLDQWTGAYANVNEISVNDGTFDTTTTSGNVQRYKMSGITGDFNIYGVVTNLRATQGGGSLTHLALTQLIDGTSYIDTVQNFPSSFEQVQFVQMTNPITGVAWTQSDLNSSTYESGYQATT